MKTTHLLYEITDKKKFTLKLIGEYAAKTYAKNKIVLLAGEGKSFVLMKAMEVI